MTVSNSPFISSLKATRKPAVFIILLIFSIAFAFMIKSMQIKGAVLAFLAIIGPLMTIAILAFPKFGVITYLIAAYLIFGVIRMGITTFPLGTIMDALLMLVMAGMFIQQKYRKDWSFLRSPVSIMIIIWIAYNLIQVVNPAALSKMAWLYTIRSMALVMLSYFVFAFYIKDRKFIRVIIRTWLGLSVFAALYGFKQQFIGFFSYEEAYLYSDPLIMDLLFINGEWRKFSIFSDPTSLSYNMIVSGLLCVGLLFSPISKLKKAVLGVFILMFIMNTLFSGTRSSYVLIPVSLVMLTVLLFNRKIMIIAGAAALLLGFLIFVPTSNPALYRFQSAFKPSDDASFNVRAANQKMIQPYIQSHPLGGGLGSTGVWGAKFSPGSFLASFPPDSGYVRVAVEMGWVGLFLFCMLLFIILRAGIKNFYTIRDPELKSYSLAMVLIVYAIAIGNYPQEAITQYPLNIYFFLVAALIDAIKNVEKEENGFLETAEAQNPEILSHNN
jgi:putative inorganic carbon (HCO3(-)) transporter